MRNIFIGIILFCSIAAYGQESQESVAAQPTLEQQFREIMQETETFKSYKVIQIERLNSFWDTVEDSIQQKENAVLTANQKIAEQQNTINKLNNTIREGRASIEEAAYDREHINVIGIDFNKATFIIISFLIIAALLAVIAFGYGKYKYSTKVAAEKSKSYDKLEEEYKNHQDKAREKQMKLKREIQTHINKIEELKHKNISFK
jgi:uncharacterized protein HemX